MPLNEDIPIGKKGEHDAIIALFSRADELLGNGKLEEAETLLRQALKRSMINLGPAHEMSVTSQEELATVLAQRGKYEEAIEINMTAWMTRTKFNDTSGRRHATQLNLARDLACAGRLQEAASHFERVYTSQTNDTESFGPENPHTLRTGCELGTCWFSCGQRPNNGFLRNKAIRLHEDVLKLQLKVEGIDEVDIIRTRAALAEDYYRLRRYGLCETLLRENMKVLTVAIGHSKKEGITVGRGGTDYRRQELESLLEKTLSRKQKLIDLNAEEPVEKERARLAKAKKEGQTKREKACLNSVEKARPLPTMEQDRHAKTKTGREGAQRAEIEKAFKTGIERARQDRIERDLRAEEEAEIKRAPCKKGREAAKPYKEKPLKAAGDRAPQDEKDADRPGTQVGKATNEVITPDQLGISDKSTQLAEHAKDTQSNPSDLKSTQKKVAVSSRPRLKFLPSNVSWTQTLPPTGTLFDALDGNPSQGPERWFRDLRIKTHALLAPLQTGAFKRVKIAVLDTGIDVEQINLWDRDRVTFMNGENPRIKKRKDFLDPDKTNKCLDHDGHGTHCIGVLRRVAPEADIYVGRVATNRQEGPSVKAVIEAISYAQTHWAVDIISLSFGFEAWITPLERAIRAAVDGSRTLVLAATSNYGTSRPMAFPACMPDVISLHAADHGGRAAGTNPAVEYGKNFTILGVDVVSAWIPSLSPPLPPSSSSDSLSDLLEAVPAQNDGQTATTRAMTGTSVATPVAAGVAALVLEFAGQRDLDDPETDQVLQKLGPFLRRQHGMNSVFRAMAVPTGAGEFLNIVPWNLLRAETGSGSGSDSDNETLGRRMAAFALRSVIKNAFGQLIE